MIAASLADLIGFAGAVIILAGFGYGTIKGTTGDPLYFSANLVGASLLAISLSVNFNLPALLLEVAWAGIALFGLLRLYFRRTP